MAEPSPDDLDASPNAIAAQEAATAELRRLRRRTQEEMWILLRLPPDRRAGKIRGARRRFRSRQLAEMLLQQCRSRARNEPVEARRIAELVPLVLRWTRQADGPAWAPALLARAAALGANALRIAGDYAAAERVFHHLHGELAARPIADPGVLADVSSLEASLRFAQHRPAEAKQLLGLAFQAFEFAGDRLGVARTKIKMAMLMRHSARSDEAIRLLREVADSLGPDPDPWLYFCTVGERAHTLIDLGRYPEAVQLRRRQCRDLRAG